MSEKTSENGVQMALDAAPEGARARMQELRALIHKVAKDCAAGPLTETLKWGQPSWLTEATKSGTTIRMGAVGEDQVALYVHCQTSLVDRYRQQFPDEFAYEGNRAVLIPATGDVPEEPLRRVIGQALTYHRDKKQK
ncbi:MAG: DUF1801 domain-containing protein [Paracoccaceae bacterium]